MLKKIKKLLASILPAPILDFLLAYQLRGNQYYKRICEIQIANSGISPDGFPFVKLENGLTFYGYLPSGAQRYYYRYFLDSAVKLQLSEESINVAYDIVVRYLGPALVDDYINQGKYYDFLPGDTVVEVGAYMGYYAMRAAEIVGKSGKVIAIEAVDENFQLLKKNVEANFFQNIVIVPKAAWKSVGSLTFYRNARQQASAISTIVHIEDEFNVICDTVDNILMEAHVDRVSFIRIQVNGAEREVLSGMSETLIGNPKLLVAAIYERSGQASWVEIRSLLEGYGYTTLVDGANVFAYRTENENVKAEIQR